MSIAEQVATLEHDLAAALAKIDELNSANAAFDSANASLRREHVALQLEINDMKHYVDDTRTMAEQLAESALKMLRASRRHVGAPPAEVIPFAKPEIVNIDRGPSPYWKNASLDEKVATLPEKWPEQKAVTEIMTGDSGDETDIPAQVDKVAADLGVTLTRTERHDAIAAAQDIAARRGTPVPRNDYTSLDPVRVEHDDNDLPVFLKNDTLARSSGPVIFA